MPDSESFNNLKAQYFFIDTHFDDLMARCQTEQDKQQLRDTYRDARGNFDKARTIAFQEDDALVQDLNTQLKQAQKKLESMIKGLDKIGAFISELATAVKVGTKLAELAAGV